MCFVNILTVENLTYTLFYKDILYLNISIYITEQLHFLVNYGGSSYMGSSALEIAMPIYMEGFRKS